MFVVTVVSNSNPYFQLESPKLPSPALAMEWRQDFMLRMQAEGWVRHCHTLIPRKVGPAVVYMEWLRSHDGGIQLVLDIEERSDTADTASEAVIKIAALIAAR